MRCQIRLCGSFPTITSDAQTEVDTSQNAPSDWLLVDVASTISRSAAKSDNADTSSSISLASSWVAICTSEDNCFVERAIFKLKDHDTEYYLPGVNLKKGSRVLASDNETILEVAAPPQRYETDVIIELGTEKARLIVTPSHRVPAFRAASGVVSSVFRAGDLQEGDQVIVNGIPE